MKLILDLTSRRFNKEQIKPVCTDECDIVHSEKPLEYVEVEGGEVDLSQIYNMVTYITCEIASQKRKPDILILEVPKNIEPYMEKALHQNSADRVYVRPKVNR